MQNKLFLLVLNGDVKKEFTTKEKAIIYTTKQSINYNIIEVDKKQYNSYKTAFKNILASDPQTKALNKILFYKKSEG